MPPVRPTPQAPSSLPHLLVAAAGPPALLLLFIVLFDQVHDSLWYLLGLWLLFPGALIAMVRWLRRRTPAGSARATVVLVAALWSLVLWLLVVAGWLGV